MRDFKGLIRRGRHLMSAACLLFVLAATTNAYSIVMRSGKRIEIPDRFNVTNMTVTYETTPGFWITLQMAAIDIPATERANNEAPGSLLGRAYKENDAHQKSETTGAVQEPKALRSITNRNLESFERQRLESERAYEQSLKDRGLPPLAELRAQAAAESERFWQEMSQKRAEAEANERTAQLQAQLAVISAQLAQIQARLDEPSWVSPDGFTVFGGVPFFGSFGHSKVNPLLFRVPPGVPIGGAFGTFHVPFFAPHRFHGQRRNVFIAPGTNVRGRGFGGRGHGGRRFH